MSPVERSKGHTGRALAVTGVGVAVVMLGLWLAATFASNQPSFDVSLGDQTFQGARADRLAGEIDARGPILFSDISDGNEQVRDIILQHVGDDEDEGWYAFRAQPADRDRTCTWEWQDDEEIFRAGCDESLTAPADGEGLERYPVEVVDGRLDIDLNFATRPTTTEVPRTTAVESGDVPEDDGDGG